MTVHLDLVDYLLIAEAVLGVPAERIAEFNRISLADSALAAPRAGFADVEAYPDFATKAAVLCWHLVKNHPVGVGNLDSITPRRRQRLTACRPVAGGGTFTSLVM